jgi:hypothetical protein
LRKSNASSVCISRPRVVTRPACFAKDELDSRNTTSDHEITSMTPRMSLVASCLCIQSLASLGAADPAAPTTQQSSPFHRRFQIRRPQATLRESTPSPPAPATLARDRISTLDSIAGLADER